MGGGGAPSLPGVPLLLINQNPQPVVSGNTKGVTLINPGTVPIILSTDATPTSSNSFTLAPNGASLPIAVGPLWAYVSSGMGTLNVFPGILNVFNPNVLAAPPGDVSIFNQVFGSATTSIIQGLTIPNGIKTLVINVINTDAVGNIPSNIQLVGNISGFTYRKGQPYLFQQVVAANVTTESQCVVPITSIDDPGLEGVASDQITLFITWASGTNGPQVRVTGSYDRYKEDTFYNGAMQKASGVAVASTTTLATGPLRLFTASLANSAAGTNASLTESGTTILESSGANGQLTFPPNTIVANGHVLAIVSSSAAIVGSITYAYP